MSEASRRPGPETLVRQAATGFLLLGVIAMAVADCGADGTEVQVPTAKPLGHAESGIDGRGVYGFNWGRNGVKPDASRLWPGAPEDAFAAPGFNNNDPFVLPSWRMVIVRLGLDEATDGPITDETYGEFLARVGVAISHGAAD